MRRQMAAGFVTVLIMWTLSLFGSSIRTGMIESYTPELNFITVSLISPLNGQHLHLTMDTMQYCISNQNSSASLEKLGIAASYGRGPISWIVGSIVRSQIPKPAPLRNGCWPWTVKLFEGLDSKTPSAALVAMHATQFTTFALAILGTIFALCLIFPGYGSDNSKLQTEDPESVISPQPMDDLLEGAAQLVASEQHSPNVSGNFAPRRGLLIAFTAFTVVSFLSALVALIVTSIFFFTIANLPGMSLEYSDAVPFIASAIAAKPSSISYTYLVTARYVGSSFILSLLSCVVLFSMLHVLLLSILPKTKVAAVLSTNSSESEQIVSVEGLRSALRRSQSSPVVQSMSARSSFSFSSSTLNPSGSSSPAFPLNQELPASAHFMGTQQPSSSDKGGWFKTARRRMFSWWIGLRLSMVRFIRRLTDQSTSRPSSMSAGTGSGTSVAGKKKVRIVEPFD